MRIRSEPAVVLGSRSLETRSHPIPHVVLLGDSIFDNAAYVAGGQTVIDQLRSALPSGWDATLLAVDGDTSEMVAVRLAELPDHATHLIVSAGGNDALLHIHLLEAERNVLPELAQVRGEFAERYREMLDSILGCGKPTAVCTIYDAVPGLTSAAKAALATFNDVIIREAARSNCPILDLRSVCDEQADFSDLSPIEPSSIGGAKIAGLVARVVTNNDFSRPACVIYGK